MTTGTAAAEDPARTRIPQWHTLVIVLLLAAQAYRASHLTLVANNALTVPKLSIYARTILFEWLFLLLIVASALWSKAPVAVVLGKRWRSLGQFAQDFAIGMAFLVVTIVVSSAMQALIHNPRTALTSLILPTNPTELVWWMAISVSAGICEEALYRGYLQHQFTALTGRAWLGIAMSATIFGGMHFYQGAAGALQIIVLGILSGVLVQWRNSTRPAMIAHTLQDVLGGVMRH